VLPQQKLVWPIDALNLILNYYNPKFTDVSVKRSTENTVSLDLVMGYTYIPLRRSAETTLTAHDVRHTARLVLNMCCALSTLLENNRRCTADIYFWLCESSWTLAKVILCSGGRQWI